MPDWLSQKNVVDVFFLQGQSSIFGIQTHVEQPKTLSELLPQKNVIYVFYFSNKVKEAFSTRQCTGDDVGEGSEAIVQHTMNT